MQIKSTFLFIIILVLFSCCNGENPVVQNAVLGIKLTADPSIFGKWGLCSQSSGDSYIQFNSCQSVEFDMNGTGFRSTDHGTVEQFTWTLKDKTLRISCHKKDPEYYFSDSVYIVYFNKKEKPVALTIEQPQKDYAFYLGKRELP